MINNGGKTLSTKAIYPIPVVKYVSMGRNGRFRDVTAGNAPKITFRNKTSVAMM